MKINTAQLKEAFSIVDCVPSVSSLETSQIVRLEFKNKQLRMSLSGRLWASTSQPLDEAGSHTLYVDRRYLSSFLSGASKTTTLAISKDAVVLRSGSHRLQLQRRQVGITGYEEWDAVKAKKATLSDPLIKLARQLAAYTSEAPGSAYMQAISLKKGYGVYATDGVTCAAALTSDVKRTVLLPVDVPSQLSKGATLLLDDVGAGVVFAEQSKVTGTLYQAMPEDCKKRYPVKQLEDFINLGVAAKPILKFELKALDTACEDLGAFQFAVTGMPLVSVNPIVNDKVHVQFSLELSSGVSEFKVACKVVKKLEPVKWTFVTLATWLKQLDGADVTISYAQIPSAHCFSTEVEGVKRLLIFSAVSDAEPVVVPAKANVVEVVEQQGNVDDDDDDVPF